MTNSTKTTENPKKDSKLNWIGALLLFVLVSIAYSTYVVYFGTTGWAPKAMLAPQAIFAAVIAINKFTSK